MKISRRQLRRLINEAMYDPMHGMRSLEEPFKSKVMSVIDDPDATEEDLEQFHQLGDAISGYKDPRPGMPDESLAGVKRQREEHARAGGASQIDSYLPGFMNLSQPIIDAVVEFVFLSKDPTLHIQLEEDILEEEIGEDMYERATNYPSRNMPENADAVAIVDSYRKNPKAHDPKFYSIYATGTSGVDPFSKIDPYLDPNSQYAAHRTGDAQSGFHDGFREEYHKVTTEPNHRISSYAVEEAIIEMMRDLRPNHKEYVIN
jgi:hypothetical protein